MKRLLALILCLACMGLPFAMAEDATTENAPMTLALSVKAIEADDLAGQDFDLEETTKRHAVGSTAYALVTLSLPGGTDLAAEGYTHIVVYANNATVSAPAEGEGVIAATNLLEDEAAALNEAAAKASESAEGMLVIPVSSTFAAAEDKEIHLVVAFDVAGQLPDVYAVLVKGSLPATLTPEAMAEIAAASDIAAETVINTLPPRLAIPGNLAVSIDNGQLTATWDAVKNAAKYRVRVTDPEGAEETLTVEGTSISVAAAKLGTYTVTLWANPQNANTYTQSYSRKQSATFDKAQLPWVTNLIFSVSSTGYSASWTAVENATSYTCIVYDPDQEVILSTSTTDTSITRSFADGGTAFPGPGEYMIGVIAVDETNTYTNSRTFFADYTVEKEKLAKITDMGLTVSAEGIRGTWTAVPNAESYMYEVYGPDGTKFTSGNAAGTSFSNTFSGMGIAHPGAGTYQLKMYARDIQGIYADSEPVTISVDVSDKEKLASVTDLTLTVTKDGFSASWTGVANASNYTYTLYGPDGGVVRTMGTGGLTTVSKDFVADSITFPGPGSYKVEVIARDTTDEYLDSDPVSKTFTLAEPEPEPLAVTSVTTSVSDLSVTVTGTVTGAGAGDTATVTIRRSGEVKHEQTEVPIVNGTVSHTFENVAPNDKYLARIEVGTASKYSSQFTVQLPRFRVIVTDVSVDGTTITITGRAENYTVHGITKVKFGIYDMGNSQVIGFTQKEKNIGAEGALTYTFSNFTKTGQFQANINGGEPGVNYSSHLMNFTVN